jgi:hypothetical protein
MVYPPGLEGVLNKLCCGNVPAVAEATLEMVRLWRD